LPSMQGVAVLVWTRGPAVTRCNSCFSSGRSWSAGRKDAALPTRRYTVPSFDQSILSLSKDAFQPQTRLTIMNCLNIVFLTDFSKTTDFWDIAPCNLVQVDRRFRGT
jgi:hypothetical protein